MKPNSCYPVVRARLHSPVSSFAGHPYAQQWPSRMTPPVKSTRPSTNIARLENGYKIELAIPGLSKDQVQIQVIEDQLVITATKTNQEKETRYVRREFDYSSFNRTYNLHKNADTANLKASFDQGILTVIIQDKEPETRKIEIQ